MNPFQQASFFASAAKPTDLPPEGRPEIAFAGRSNVGKSSAINALAGRRRLAFVSKTPGRTQMINFFDLGGGGWLVDLPGYGYAKVPQELRAGWEALVGGYLAERESLVGVVALVDARHPLTAHDRRLLEWLRPRELPCLVLLTKSDKLSRAERARALGARELVGLGEQHEARQLARPQPFEQPPVVRRERVARIHQRDHANQGFALRQVAADQRLPACAQLLRHLGITVAGQVHQPPPAAQVEEIDHLRAPRRLADERQAPAPSERIDRARLADVRAASERNLRPALGRQVGGFRGGGEETRLLERVQGMRRVAEAGNSNKIAAFDRTRPGAPA